MFYRLAFLVFSLLVPPVRVPAFPTPTYSVLVDATVPSADAGVQVELCGPPQSSSAPSLGSLPPIATLFRAPSSESVGVQAIVTSVDVGVNSSSLELPPDDIIAPASCPEVRCSSPFLEDLGDSKLSALLESSLPGVTGDSATDRVMAELVSGNITASPLLDDTVGEVDVVGVDPQTPDGSSVPPPRAPVVADSVVIPLPPSSSGASVSNLDVAASSLSAPPVPPLVVTVTGY